MIAAPVNSVTDPHAVVLKVLLARGSTRRPDPLN
jgi:hypothetical protein